MPSLSRTRAELSEAIQNAAFKAEEAGLPLEDTAQVIWITASYIKGNDANHP